MYAAATTCAHTADAIELCGEYGLYLKPIARILISIAMPSHASHSVKVLSNWEVMEKIRKLAEPIQMLYLKVVKSTNEFMRYEGEIDNAAELKTLIELLDGKIIKLGGYLESFKVRAKECKNSSSQVSCSEESWNTFFESWSESDETQPGLRPDTIFVQSLPSRWFAPNAALLSSTPNSSSGMTGTLCPNPSPNPQQMEYGEKCGGGVAVVPEMEMVERVFSTFGPIRLIDIPILDPYRANTSSSCDVSTASRKGIGTFSAFGPGTSGITFSAFIQYEDYSAFATAMEALTKNKLMYKPPPLPQQSETGAAASTDESGSSSSTRPEKNNKSAKISAAVATKSYVANIKVDFDRSGHLSEKQILRRKIESMRVKQLEKERQEAQERQREQMQAKAKAQQLACCSLLKPRSILLRAAENAAEVERQRLKAERKMLRNELREKDKKEKLLLEIEKKNASLQRLATQQAKFQFQQKLQQHRNEALNLLNFLINALKDVKSGEIVERRLADLEAARLVEVEKQRRLIAQLQLQQMAQKEKQEMLLQQHESNLRKRLLHKMSTGGTSGGIDRGLTETRAECGDVHRLAALMSTDHSGSNDGHCLAARDNEVVKAIHTTVTEELVVQKHKHDKVSLLPSSSVYNLTTSTTTTSSSCSYSRDSKFLHQGEGGPEIDVIRPYSHSHILGKIAEQKRYQGQSKKSSRGKSRKRRRKSSSSSGGRGHRRKRRLRSRSRNNLFPRQSSERKDKDGCRSDKRKESSSSGCSSSSSSSSDSSSSSSSIRI